MSKDARKAALKKAWRDQENQKLLASIPMSHEDLRALFDYLDSANLPPCDHTHRCTIQFLKEKKLNIELVIPWLSEHGGHCDCEVLANVEDTFGPLVSP